MHLLHLLILPSDGIDVTRDLAERPLLISDSGTLHYDSFQNSQIVHI